MIQYLAQFAIQRGYNDNGDDDNDKYFDDNDNINICLDRFLYFIIQYLVLLLKQAKNIAK